MITFILTLLLSFGGLHPMDVGTGPTGSMDTGTGPTGNVVPIHVPVHHPRPADVGTGPTG